MEKSSIETVNDKDRDVARDVDLVSRHIPDTERRIAYIANELALARHRGAQEVLVKLNRSIWSITADDIDMVTKQ